jgi:hypothetical protein
VGAAGGGGAGHHLTYSTTTTSRNNLRVAGRGGRGRHSGAVGAGGDGARGGHVVPKTPHSTKVYFYYFLWKNRTKCKNLWAFPFFS